MSILINGMEMPTSCYDCNCFIRDSDGSDYCCLLMQDIEDNNKRDDDCPIVPVPPHGDLIDKKTVSENLASVLNKKNPPFSYPDWNDAIVAMMTAPTIIPSSGGIEDE